MSTLHLRKSTAVLFVERIEPSLAFWSERLGFAITAEVPGENGLAFVILERDGVEVMLQTAAALRADPHAGNIQLEGDHGFLFIEVEDIDAVDAALKDAEMVSPRHETFYGATEIGYREPGGHYVTFAQFNREPAVS